MIQVQERMGMAADPMFYDTYSVYRSGRDLYGIFTVITYKDSTGNTRQTSTLSGGTAPYYTTKTVVNYDSDGITVLSTRVFALSYSNGELISEVLQ